jgi:hypothetical protein
VDKCLEHFAHARSAKGKGVTQPSQLRYVRYFCGIISNKLRILLRRGGGGEMRGGGGVGKRGRQRELRKRGRKREFDLRRIVTEPINTHKGVSRTRPEGLLRVR